MRSLLDRYLPEIPEDWHWLDGLGCFALIFLYLRGLGSLILLFWDPRDLNWPSDSALWLVLIPPILVSAAISGLLVLLTSGILLKSKGSRLLLRGLGITIGIPVFLVLGLMMGT